MSNELTTRAPDSAALTTAPTIGELQDRLAKAREFMANAMVKGIDGDYAVIPGTGSKPSLLKPGAEKLARLFGLSIVSFDRTMLERVDDGFVAGYLVTLAGPDGRTWGGAEAFASEAERTFERNKASGPALLNALTSRAQKRAYVRAVIQAIGLSDLFAGDLGDTELLNETQRAVVAAIYEAVAPRMVEQAKRQATRVRQNQWSAFLGAALDTAADLRGWSDDDRERAERRLSDELATADTVVEFFAALDADVIDVVATEDGGEAA